MKLKILALSAIVLSACSPEITDSGGTIDCAPSPYSGIAVGDRLPDSATNTSELILASSSGLIPKRILDTGDFIYNLGISKDESIKFISIDDPKFKTSQCISVGMSLEKVEQISGNAGQIERGWAYYVPLNDGWNAGIMTSEKTVPGKSKVTFLFKR